jgi:hypothetical protein
MSCGIGIPGPDQHPIGRKCWTRASRHEHFEDLVARIPCAMSRPMRLPVGDVASPAIGRSSPGDAVRRSGCPRDCRGAGLDDPFTFFLTRAKVAFNDGAAFGPPGAGHVRLNFGTPRALLTEGLERMRTVLGAR